MAKIFLMQPVVLFPSSIDLRPNIFVVRSKKWIARHMLTFGLDANLAASTGDAFDGQFAKVKIYRLF